MIACVKCGLVNAEGAEACGRCFWPFTNSAWPFTDSKIRRVTLDTGCVNAKCQDADLNALERWASEGHLELQRAPAMLQEMRGAARIAKAQSLDPHPQLFTFGSSGFGGGGVLGGPDLKAELKEILFPRSKQLTENQQADIEHLHAHIHTGGDVFVTHNPNDFIVQGRQEALASFGVWVMRPQELVALLKKKYGWQAVEDAVSLKKLPPSD